jgi:hypothetical protein
MYWLIVQPKSWIRWNLWTVMPGFLDRRLSGGRAFTHLKTVRATRPVRSLSDDVHGRLEQCTRRLPGTNPSLLTDLALKLLLTRPDTDIAAMAAKYRLDRRSATRDGWRKAIWILLGQEMGCEDLIGNPYVPRNFGDYYTVLLQSHVTQDDGEEDPFYFSLGLRGHAAGKLPPPSSPGWTFHRSTSPVQAAETIARDLKALGVRLDYDGIVDQTKAILAERLGSDTNNADRFGDAQFHPAMMYGADGERGMMVWNIMRLTALSTNAKTCTSIGVQAPRLRWLSSS